MDQKTIERMPDLLRRLVDDYLSAQKKLDRLEVYARVAANIIEQDAESMRLSHTINGDWGEDNDAEKEYGDMIGCVAGIRDILKT